MCFSIIRFVPKGSSIPAQFVTAVDEMNEGVILDEKRRDPFVATVEVYRFHSRERRSESWDKETAEPAASTPASAT